MDEQQSTIQPIIQPAIKLEKPKKKNFWPMIGLVAIVILIGAIFLILRKYCGLQPRWLLGIILADYLVLLTINYFGWFKKTRWVFGMFLTVLVVLMAVVAGPWSFWFWALAVILYLITLLQYFLKSLDGENAWSVIIPLTLFLVLMLFKLQRFNCLN